MSRRPVQRIIYLNGEDTGLKAWSPNDAASKLAQVLRRRGWMSATPELLATVQSGAPGRVDFTWPPENVA